MKLDSIIRDQQVPIAYYMLRDKRLRILAGVGNAPENTPTNGTDA